MQFEVKRQIIKLVGATIRTYDETGQLISRADQKGFKLKEQIEFYRDENNTQPIFSIQARNVLDIAATYDINDHNGQRIASLRRKGLSSTFVRDEWLVLNASEQEVGVVKEDSTALGLLRRWVDLISLLVPQKFVLTVNGAAHGHMQQNKNPLTIRMKCQFTPDAVQLLGEQVVLAIPNMLAIIEQRQG